MKSRASNPTAEYHEILLATATELEGMPKPPKALVARLREAAAMLERAPPERREKIATALRVLDPRLVSLPAPVTSRRDQRFGGGESGFGFSQDAKPLSEAYPEASLQHQARIVLGENPASVTGLTAKEAHTYLSLKARFHSPATWLINDRAPAAAVWVSTERLDSVPIARWLIDRWRDPAQREAMEIYREERGPDGGVVGGRFIERVDELKDEDLRPSVRATFEAATQRMVKELEHEAKRAKNQKPIAPQPSWWQPVRCATLLNRPAQFAAEGKEMEHCVLTHMPLVRKGEYVVVSLRVTDKHGVVHKSTVELDRATMHVIQHRGVKNAPPSKLSEKALQVCLKRWKQKKEGPAGSRAENPAKRRATSKRETPAQRRRREEGLRDIARNTAAWNEAFRSNAAGRALGHKAADLAMDHNNVEIPPERLQDYKYGAWLVEQAPKSAPKEVATFYMEYRRAYEASVDAAQSRALAARTRPQGGYGREWERRDNPTRHAPAGFESPSEDENAADMVVDLVETPDGRLQVLDEPMKEKARRDNPAGPAVKIGAFNRSGDPDDWAAPITIDGIEVGYLGRETEAENVASRGGNSSYKYTVVGYRVTLWDIEDEPVFKSRAEARAYVVSKVPEIDLVHAAERVARREAQRAEAHRRR